MNVPEQRVYYVISVVTAYESFDDAMPERPT